MAIRKLLFEYKMNSKVKDAVLLAIIIVALCFAIIANTRTRHVRVEMYIYHSDGTTEGNMYHDMKVYGNTYYGKRLSDSVVFKIVKP